MFLMLLRLITIYVSCVLCWSVWCETVKCLAGFTSIFLGLYEKVTQHRSNVHGILASLCTVDVLQPHQSFYICCVAKANLLHSLHYLYCNLEMMDRVHEGNDSYCKS